MRLTLPQLETFYWIARLGSFHAAARHLNLTQPTVSVRIRELERELNGALFARTGGRARLTGRGLEALDQAERILALALEMKQERLPGGSLRGLLRLGVVETVARLAVPDLLGYLQAGHAGLRVELTVDVGATLSRRLNERELDVIIATDPRPGEHVATELLGQVELAWIVGARHPLALRRVSAAELRDQRIFTHPKGSTTHDLVEGWFRQAHVEPTQVNVCNSLSTMVELVAAGLGLAVVTPALSSRELREGLIQRLAVTPTIPSRPLFLCCLREAWSEEVDELVRRTRHLLTEAGALLRA